MVTGAMELKRLRLASKTLIVVQNATLRQFAEFAPKLYPHAQILIADKKDLVREKRKRFMSRIAVGDWDMVIMAQSSFDMIKDDPDLVARHYEEQIAELEQIIEESEDQATIQECGTAEKAPAEDARQAERQKSRRGYHLFFRSRYRRADDR